MKNLTEVQIRNLQYMFNHTEIDHASFNSIGISIITSNWFHRKGACDFVLEFSGTIKNEYKGFGIKLEIYDKENTLVGKGYSYRFTRSKDTFSGYDATCITVFKMTPVYNTECHAVICAEKR